jgi:hypothetical protein
MHTLFNDLVNLDKRIDHVLQTGYLMASGDDREFVINALRDTGHRFLNDIPNEKVKLISNRGADSGRTNIRINASIPRSFFFSDVGGNEMMDVLSDYIRFLYLFMKDGKLWLYFQIWWDRVYIVSSELKSIKHKSWNGTNRKQSEQEDIDFETFMKMMPLDENNKFKDRTLKSLTIENGYCSFSFDVVDFSPYVIHTFELKYQL